MLTIPKSTAESASPLELEFNERADRWEREASIHSAPAPKFLHRDYQWIISRGKPAIPLILKRLQTSRKDWFWALELLADDNPAKQSESFAESARLWLKWGYDNHYLP
jgi:hypothetical protein